MDAWLQKMLRWRDKYSKVNLEILKARRKACVDCGWNKIPSVLEFHHVVVDTSNIELGTSALNHTTTRFLREIDKGLFLCPTCHRCRHYDPMLDKVDLNNKTLR